MSVFRRMNGQTKMTAMAIAAPREYIAPYQPLKWQHKPLRDKSPIVLLSGSAGGGKSRCAAEKVHAFCLKYPGATVLMMRKTFSSMVNSTVSMVNSTVSMLSRKKMAD